MVRPWRTALMTAGRISTSCSAATAKHGVPLRAFDLLWLEAQDLHGIELIGRRRMLQKGAEAEGAGAALLGAHGVRGRGDVRHACAMGLEGIVSKRVASRSKSGSCIAWVKVKKLGI